MALFKNPADGGMLYAETNLQHFFPEPLNTLTSCLFIAIAVYWTFKLRRRTRQHTFLIFAIALLYIGGVGGTLYHGLRQWRFFIMMDWVPIMLLCVAAGIYFMARLTRWYYAVALVILYICLQIYLRQLLAESDLQLFININYALLASLVLFPVLGFLVSTRFRNGKWVVMALVAFVAALTFRVADGWGWLENRTHFLWHVFGAIAGFCMLQYIYLMNEKQPGEN